MSNNVFKFPESRIVREVVPNLEEVEKAKEKGKQNYADGILGEVVAGLYAELENYGIDVDDEKQGVNKDFIFLTDVLKAVIYRNMGLEHPLHSFVEDNVEIFTNEKEYRAHMENAEKEEEETETTEV